MSPTTDAAAAAPPPPPPGPGEEPVVIKQSVITHVFFAFACAATVARAFEAGVVSSAMPRIAASLRLDYAQEGVVAAAPDYGIVPAGIIAMALFERVRARKVLVGACALPAVAAAAAALRPSYRALVAARALGGLGWGCAAVHFPAWVDARAPSKRKPLWLALLNVCLLGGILCGFAIGSAVSAPWTRLYLVEAGLMALAAVSAACFPAEIMDVARTGEAQRLLGAAAPQRPGLTKLRATLATPVVALTVGAGAFVCGTVGFVLYFIKQVAAREAPSWPTSLQTTAVSAVFVTAPIPGNLVGAYVVEKRIGGYDRLAPTLSFVSAAALGAVGCVALLPLAGPGRPWPFIALCWGFLFFGALPTPAINGVVLAASPRDAATIASGIQFAAQNLMKAIVPLVGGRVVDRVGLLLGFRSVLLACAAGYAAFALLARSAAADHVRHDPAPDDAPLEAPLCGDVA